VSARAAALVGLIVLGGALLVVIAVTTPWRPLPGDVPGGAVAAAPARDFTTEEIAHEDAFHRDVRPPAYASMLVSLALALVLGLTPWGARIVERVAAPLGGGWGWQILLGGIAISLL
jgi:STE24 endopeptidase